METNKQKTRGDTVMERAAAKGLSADRSGINANQAHRRLRDNTKKRYKESLKTWFAYVNIYGPSDPREMQVMKHFVKALGLGMKGKLDKEDELPTVDTLRSRTRQFYNAWERHHETQIPIEVKSSMAHYIQSELADEISLKRIRREQVFLTIENFVKLHDFLWFEDFHDYAHEGYRVDNASLLNTHCFSSARVSELCGAKYRDLVLLVGWNKGEPELKLKVRRTICKGKDDRQPEHIMPEKISSNSGPPPLYSQPMLFWLANIISSKVIVGNPSLEEILKLVPQDGRNHRVIDMTDDMKDHQVFPKWTASGPEQNARSPCSVSQHISDWAKRTGFVNGIGGLHSIRREALIKANADSGQSVEQLQLFADHRSSAVLQRHYLGTMNTVDGVASYLGMDVRGDLAEDFRSATMRWNSDLALQLPSQEHSRLQRDEEYLRLTHKISSLTTLIDNEVSTEQEREKHLACRKQAYEDRRKFERRKLREYQQIQQKFATPQQSDWRRGHLFRIIHMLPERQRLLHTLAQREPLRSPTGISALKDLIALRTGDCRVAYQSELKPQNGLCPVEFCDQKMESLPVTKRWPHIYHCFKKFFQKKWDFASFCFLCSCWIATEQEWEQHCQSHIDNRDIPLRCDPVVFRHAYACAGYCPVHLGRKDLPAKERMKTYLNLSTWRRHVLQCVTGYITAESDYTRLSCPHPNCPSLLDSKEKLWYHLEDIHSVDGAPSRKRKMSIEASEHTRAGSIRFAKKRRTRTAPTRVPAEMPKFQPPDPKMASFASSSSSTSFTCESTSAGQDDKCSTISTGLSSLEDFYVETSPDNSFRYALVNDSGFTGSWISQSAPPSVPSITLDQRPTELIDPGLAEVPVPGSKSGLLENADSLSKNYNTTAPSTQEGAIGISPSQLSRSPTALGANDDIWDVEELLAKRVGRGKRSYLVKWEGFSDEDNSWEPEENISPDLIESFESTFDGNLAGVRLLKKRISRGKAQYFVEWKGRPKSERSWENARTLSNSRVEEYEAEAREGN